MSGSLDAARDRTVDAEAVKALAGRCRTELLDSVMPFWMTHSLDWEQGGYFSCLDRTGGVFDPRKYIWMQGRQVWMLSRLYREVERREEWLDAARLGVEFLRRFGQDAEGRCYFSLTRDGLPAGYQRKPYAAVFTMLGFLEYARATGKSEYLDQAVILFRKVREWIADPSLLGRPELSRPPASQLADVMVTLSMALELYAADPKSEYSGAIEACVRKAALHYDAGRRLFREQASLNGGVPGDLPEWRLCCPGHSMEMAWFLLHAAELFPDSGVERMSLDAIEGSLENGWDAEYGGIYYFRDLEDRPVLKLEASMKLWWPHTEALYALVLAYLRTKESRWVTWIERIDAYSHRCFADPEFGEWFGYCDRRGEVTQQLKGGSYKGCFHLPRCLLFIAQRCGEIGTPGSPSS